ncbi:MAG: hypothetical protein QM520_02950, partial [Gammaproteobacteria bacterium]|nr:hypothetical protein [Gammaproteobacteria bacterium]
ALDHSPVPTATLVKAEVLEVLTEPPKPSDFQLAQVLLPTPSNALDHSPVPTATLVKAEVLTQPDFVAPLVEVLVRKSEQATPTSTTVTHLNVQDTPLPLASSALEPTPYLRLTPPLSHAKLSHNEFAKLEPGLYQPKPIPTTSPLAPHLHEVASLEQLHQPNSLLDAPKLVSQTSFSDHPPSYLDPVAVPIVSFAQPTVKTQATENDSKDLVFQLDHISLPPAWSQNQYAPNGHLVTVQISVPITQDPTPYIISLPSPQIEPVAYQLADVALPSSFLPSHLATTQIVATGSEFVPSSIHLIEGQILTSQLAYVATEMSIDWVAGSFQKDTQPDSLMAGQTFERLYAFPEELEERILAENTSKTTLDDLLVAQTKSNADYRLEHIQIPQPFQLVAVQKFTAPLWITEVKPKLDWPLNHVQIPALYSFPQISSEIESVSTALDDTAKVEPDVTWQVADFYMGPPSLQALPTSDSYGYRSLLKLPPPYFNWQSKDRYIYSFNDPHARITKNRIGLLVDFADD